MKRFLYMDTDYVNLINTQAGNDLMHLLTGEKQAQPQQTENQKPEETKRVKNGILPGKSGKGGAFNKEELAKLVAAGANLTSDIEIKKGMSLSSASRKVVSNAVNDAAFGVAMKELHITPVEFGEAEGVSLGTYVELKRDFDYADADVIRTLSREDGLVNFIRNIDQERAKQTLKEVKMMKIMRDLVPYERMLVANDGFLVPLEDEYFRVGQHEIGFNYGGKLICVGIVTNIIGETTEQPQNIFASMQNTFNDTLRIIMDSRDRKLYVVHPIAVYHEV